MSVIQAAYKKNILGRDFFYQSEFKVPDHYEDLAPLLRSSRRLRKLLGIGLMSLDLLYCRICILSHVMGRYAQMVNPLQMDKMLMVFELFTDGLPQASIMPYISHWGNRRYLPPAKMEHVTCREWLFMNEYLESYVSGEEVASWQLLALLARPEDKESTADDPRHKLKTRTSVNKEARRLKRWYNGPMYWERGVCIFYAYSMRSYIQELYETTLFKKSNEDNSSRVHFGWYETFLRVAESGVFGSINDVMDCKFHDIAVYLITKIQDAEEIKKENIY